jgi:hypothetical protein
MGPIKWVIRLILAGGPSSFDYSGRACVWVNWKTILDGGLSWAHAHAPKLMGFARRLMDRHPCCLTTIWEA